MEKNSLSPELKWEWVSDNLLRNLLHLESDYTSEPRAVIPFHCCTTIWVERLLRLLFFLINRERQSVWMPTYLSNWKKPSPSSSSSGRCHSWQGRGGAVVGELHGVLF